MALSNKIGIPYPNSAVAASKNFPRGLSINDVTALGGEGVKEVAGEKRELTNLRICGNKSQEIREHFCEKIEFFLVPKMVNYRIEHK